jgi:hypothetical protein
MERAGEISSLIPLVISRILRCTLVFFVYHVDAAGQFFEMCAWQTHLRRRHLSVDEVADADDQDAEDHRQHSRVYFVKYQDGETAASSQVSLS